LNAVIYIAVLEEHLMQSYTLPI